MGYGYWRTSWGGSGSGFGGVDVWEVILVGVCGTVRKMGIMRTWMGMIIRLTRLEMRAVRLMMIVTYSVCDGDNGVSYRNYKKLMEILI